MSQGPAQLGVWARASQEWAHCHSAACQLRPPWACQLWGELRGRPWALILGIQTGRSGLAWGQGRFLWTLVSVAVSAAGEGQTAHSWRRSAWEPRLQAPPRSSPAFPAPEGGLWGRRTQALTAAKGSSRGVSRGSGDGHRMAVGGIVLRRRETGKAWFHSHSTPGEEGGQGGRGLAAGLHHSWQLCQ